MHPDTDTADTAYAIEHRPTGPVMARLNELELLLDGLEAAVTHLTVTLDPILGPQPPYPGDTPGEDVDVAPPQSILADRLAMAAHRVEDYTARLRRTDDRIEL